MRIAFTDRIPAPLDVVEAAILEASFQQRLRGLPNVAERAVTLQEERPDGTVRRIARYRYGGDLPAGVERAVGTSALTWDEVGVFHPSRHEWTFEVEPHVFSGRLECRGTYRLRSEGEATIREIDLDVRVNVPIVGARAERAIAEGLEETIRAEGEILSTYLEERSESSR